MKTSGDHTSMASTTKKDSSSTIDNNLASSVGVAVTSPTTKIKVTNTITTRTNAEPTLATHQKNNADNTITTSGITTIPTTTIVTEGLVKNPSDIAAPSESTPLSKSTLGVTKTSEATTIINESNSGTSKDTTPIIVLTTIPTDNYETTKNLEVTEKTSEATTMSNSKSTFATTQRTEQATEITRMSASTNIISSTVATETTRPNQVSKYTTELTSPISTTTNDTTSATTIASQNCTCSSSSLKAGISGIKNLSQNCSTEEAQRACGTWDEENWDLIAFSSCSTSCGDFGHRIKEEFFYICQLF